MLYQMVLTNSTPTTPTTTTTPDSDNDTPPRTQPIRQFSFANGTTKNHPYHQHHHLHHQPPPHGPVTYKECLKNHAANLGGHALDGCGEFMPSINANTNVPASLTCAACGCHRNFHRRELDEYSPFMPSVTPHFIDFRQPRRSSSSPSPPPPPPPPPPPQQQPAVIPYPPSSQMLLALSTAAQEDQQVPHNQYTVVTPLTPRDAKAAEQNSSGRKRFRTKFTQQQKEKMHSFAESMGWKMQKSDQTAVENFCNEIGVAKGVLKVWMHNHKNSTFGSKRDSSNHRTNTATADDENVSSGGRVSRNENGYNMNRSLNNDGDDDNNLASGNGSSPSS